MSFILFSMSVPLIDLHSFPTRRSSDLKVRVTFTDNIQTADLNIPTWPFSLIAWIGDVCAVLLIAVRTFRLVFKPRSEEHTSELQSRRDLVCRLLLEKKK